MASRTPTTSILSIGKFEPPGQRVRLAQRVALLDRLEAWRECALTLVLSPPGFGKTTLLTQWREQLKLQPGILVAWLAVDEDDAEPARFISDIILSLHRAGLAVGALESVAENELLETPEKSALFTLIGKIVGSDRKVVLILDDYQFAHSDSANDIVETLLRHCPDNFHLAISTRDLPSIHLSALVARGVVQTMDASDLAFSFAESAALFKGLLTPEEHDTLYLRSEGWAVVSQLARIWLQRHAERGRSLRDFDGRQVEVANYLSEQVLQDLPESLQQVLLDASVFERFCPALLDHARDCHDSAALLSDLAHLDALVVPVDHEREWYRFHSLFGDFLRGYRKARQTERTKILRLRASDWFLLHGDLLEAVRQCVYAKDVTRAIDLIERNGGWQLIMSHGVGFVSNVLKLFPAATRNQHPQLLVVQAYLCIKRGNWAEVRRSLDLARTLIDASSDPSDHGYVIIDALRRTYFKDSDHRAQLRQIDRFARTLNADDHVTRATAYAICATCAIALGEFAKVEDYGRKGVEDMRAGQCIVGTAYCMFHLGQSFYYRGDWQTAEEIFRESLQLAESNFGKDSMLKAVASGLLARLAYDRNHLAEAGVLVVDSLDVIEHQDGWFDIYALTFETAVRIAYAERGSEAGLVKLRHVRDFAKLRSLLELERLADAWEWEYEASGGSGTTSVNGNGDGRGPWAADDSVGSWREHHAWAVAWIRCAIAKGRYADVLRLADEEFTRCDVQGRKADAALMHAFSALALKGQGRTSRALERFAHAVVFAERAQAVRMFFQLGPAVDALIRDILNERGILPAGDPCRDFLHGVQRELQDNRDEMGRVPLSQRELDVLREMCKGHSNKLIGRTLGVSENTVKFHLKHVFRKLDVNSRTEALAKAGQLSIPPPVGHRRLPE